MQGLHEERARVVFYFPVSHTGEVYAYNKIISYLSNQKQAPASKITGFTTTNIFPSPYHGYWWNDIIAQWQDEEMAQVYIDYDIKLSSSSGATMLDQELRALKTFCLNEYQMAGRPQAELWIVVYKIQRFD